MVFWKKKEPIKSDEYEDLTKSLIKIVKELDLLKIKVETLETTSRSLRAKLNRVVLPDDSNDNNPMFSAGGF